MHIFDIQCTHQSIISDYQLLYHHDQFVYVRGLKNQYNVYKKYNYGDQ